MSEVVRYEAPSVLLSKITCQAYIIFLPAVRRPDKQPKSTYGLTESIKTITDKPRQKCIICEWLTNSLAYAVHYRVTRGYGKRPNSKRN
jgi:hypothetical protein